MPTTLRLHRNPKLRRARHDTGDIKHMTRINHRSRDPNIIQIIDGRIRPAPEEVLGESIATGIGVEGGNDTLLKGALGGNQTPEIPYYPPEPLAHIAYDGCYLSEGVAEALDEAPCAEGSREAAPIGHLGGGWCCCC